MVSVPASHPGVRRNWSTAAQDAQGKKNNQLQSKAARPPRVRSRPSKPKRPPRPRCRRWSVYVADVRAPLLSIRYCLSVSPVHVLPDATVLSRSISSKFPRLTGSLDPFLPSITKCPYSLPLSPFSLFYDFLSLLRFSRRYRSLPFCLSPRRYSPTFRRSDDRRHIIYTLHTPPTPHHTPKQQSTHA